MVVVQHMEGSTAAAVNGEAEGGGGGGSGSGTEDVVHKARSLMRRIVSNRHVPEPCLLHSLASILEQEESRYEQQAGHPYTNNSRSSHTIGRLVNMIREDDHFFELVSSKFLVDSGHSIRVRASAARLLLACISCWMYPHVFEDQVLVSIKQWVIEDPPKTGDWRNGMSGGRSLATSSKKGSEVMDREMLRTYATGLLAVALQGGDVVEDVLTTGMVAKLMHYLRIRTLGESNVETGPAVENRSLVGGRVREEVRSRARMHLDSSRMEENRSSDRVGIEKVGTDQAAVDRSSERGGDVKGKRKDEEGGAEEKDGRTTVEASDQAGQTYDADEDVEVGEDKRRRKDKGDLKRRGIVSGEWFGHTRPTREEDGEENGRAEPSKRRIDIRDRGGGRGRGKGRSGDGGVETPQSGGVRVGELVRRRSLVDRGSSKLESTSESGKGTEGAKDGGSKDGAPSLEAGKEDEEPAPCVMIGMVDVGRIIQTAARAAEAEARAAFAPLEAIKAAGDAAADLVKLAATEALATGPDDGAAIVEAAKAAAATVVDAAEAINVNTSREAAAAASADPDVKMKSVEEVAETKDHKCELGEKGVCGVEVESLAALRDLYCVQCLEKMGEYLEVLGPVLHERGVDVCLALLQRQSKDSNSVKDMTMLSEVLKLICSLAAHRKFASLLVDRGGVQQLLATPRVPLTLIGISLCLFAFASLQGVMERVCALPASVVQEIVALGLQLLACSQDPARRNAALFFGSAFVFRAILDAFESQDGLQKFLNLLRNAAHLRSGGGSSGGGAAVVSRNDRGLAAEVLTSSGKQIAYHSCVALRQYFRAHLLVLVDSLRPLKGHRGGSRNSSSGRAIYKPADLSNEAMDAIILQLQRDRKLGPAFVKYHWTQLEKFMNHGGHTILLELTQASPNERYLHEISQHALGVLQIVTLMPFTRKLVVGSTLSNERTGMAVILDAASGAGLGYDPEVIQSALLVLVNLVCPPPSLCSRPNLPSSTPGPAHASHAQVPTPVSGLPLSASGSGTSGVSVESRDRSDRSGKLEVATDKNGGERPAGTSNGFVSAPGHVAPSTPLSSAAGVVGDRRISLGPGAGGSGLAAYMEQGYRYAREAVRANNGIKVLLHLLYPRQLFPPGALDCIRALSCRVLLGLARDNAIAHILTKLQVGKILSELLRDGAQAGRQAGAGGHGEQGRWQAELGRVALELIAIVTNAGRASTMAASEAAAPTLRRIERAAIAAATPISYHSRELLQLIHEHLVASGLPTAAAALLKEARIKPLPSTLPSVPIQYSCPPTKSYWEDHQWPGGRVPGGFLAVPGKSVKEDDEMNGSLPSAGSSRKKVPVFSPALVGGPKAPVTVPLKKSVSGKLPPPRNLDLEALNGSGVVKNTGVDSSDNSFKTPTSSRTILPLKRKAGDKDTFPVSPIKRVAQFESGFTATPFTPPNSRLKSSLMVDTGLPPVPGTSFSVQNDVTVKSVLTSTQFDKTDICGSFLYENSSHSDASLSPCPSFFARYQGTPMSVQVPLSGLASESRACPAEHTSLDSLVVQYLKHQHRQCPAPITTLPPLSLLHPHVCPEPSRTLDAPLNTTVRLASREVRAPYGGVHGRRHDRHFVYSRFRPWRTCRDDAVILTATTFLGQASCLAAGSHAGDIRLFDSSSGNILEQHHSCHTSPITLLQSAPREIGSGVEGLASHTGQLLLSSAGYDVRLWDSSLMSNGALHTFDGCRAARFNHSGSRFGAVGLESPQKEVLLYDVATCKLEHRLSDNSPVVTARGHNQAMVHFSPSDVLVLWSGVLWDHRIPRAIHRFDQFTDYGGGGFHPAGNEIIINSEVWDMRSFKLLRSVQSLDQTTITFNATGDVIYATLRRNSDDIMAALNPRRVRHPLFAAFRTMDAVDYSDIATTPVDRCVLDLATEPTDSFIAVVSMDSNEEMDSFARLYEVGRRRPTDDDSDPDDGGETEDEDSEADDDDEDDDGDLHGDVDDSDIDLASNDDDDDGSGDDDDDVDDDVDVDFGDSSDDDGSDDGLGGNILELISEGEDGMTRRTFSSDEGSGGDFGDDAFDDMLHQLM